MVSTMCFDVSRVLQCDRYSNEVIKLFNYSVMMHAVFHWIKLFSRPGQLIDLINNREYWK